MTVHTIDTAAERLGIDREYLRSLIKHRTGPAFFRPSPKKTLFWEADLDSWREGWQRISADRK